MKILVTGYMGFVGRAFYRFLKDKGHILIGIDIKDKNSEVFTDCRDFFAYDSTEKYDLVIHLAAIVGGRMKIEHDPIAVATDLAIDADMFNWAVRTKQSRIVYFSSSAAYPIALQDKQYKLKESDIDLSSIKNPDMTYGWSKLTGEMLADYARKQGINVHVFRPFSGYGEDQDLDYPFPSFINRVLAQEQEFTIWGSGRQVRDFIHVDDIVEAVMKAVELDIQDPINLGSGIPTSFEYLADTMIDIYNRDKMRAYKPGMSFDTSKPEGVRYRCSNNSKMLDFYKPKISLEEGIRRFYKPKISLEEGIRRFYKPKISLEERIRRALNEKA